MATRSRRRRIAEQCTWTTNLTPSEVASADTSPDPIPTEYHRLVNLLHCYACFLQTVVGDWCGHYIEVCQIAGKIISQQQIFESLGAKQIASLLWQTCTDAGHFFSYAGCFFSSGIDVQGNLPQSLLRKTYNKVAIGNVQVCLKVPYSQQMGQDPGQSLDGLQSNNKQEGSNLVSRGSGELQSQRRCCE